MTRLVIAFHLTAATKASAAFPVLLIGKNQASGLLDLDTGYLLIRV